MTRGARCVSISSGSNWAMLGVALILLAPHRGFGLGNYLRIDRGTNAMFSIRAGAIDAQPRALQVSTNLTGANWVTIAAITNEQNEIQMDEFGTNAAQRFYRLADLPGVRAPARLVPGVSKSSLTFSLLDPINAGNSNGGWEAAVTTLPGCGQLLDLTPAGLTNGDFAQGTNGWTTWVASGSATFDFQATSLFAPGTQNLRVSLAAGGVAGVYQPLSVQPGERYRVSSRAVDYTDGSSFELWVGQAMPQSGTDYGAGAPATLLYALPYRFDPPYEFVATQSNLWLLVKYVIPSSGSGVVDWVRVEQVTTVTSAPHVVQNPRGEVEWRNACADTNLGAFQYTLKRLSDGLVSPAATVQPTILGDYQIVPRPAGREDEPLYFQLLTGDDPRQGMGTLCLLARPVYGHFFQVAEDNLTRGPQIWRLGEAVWNAHGWLCYQPPANGCGTNFDSYSFAMLSPKVASMEYWVFWDTQCVPDPPFIPDSGLNRQVYNFPLTIGLPSGDVDSPPPQYIVTKYPTNGFLTQYGDNWVGYSPNDMLNTNAGYWGAFHDQFSYYVVDDTGLRSPEATIQVFGASNLTYRVIPTETNVTTNCRLLNAEPIFADFINPNPDPTYYMHLLQLPTNGVIYGANLTYVVGLNSELVRLSPTDPWCYYVATNLYAKEDNFTYFFPVFDAVDSTPIVSVRHLQIAPIPIAQNMVVTNSWNQSSPIALNIIDPDGQTLNYEIIQEPVHGALAGSFGGPPLALYYTPQTNFFGVDTFQFRGIRQDGTTGNVATATLYTIIPTASGLVHYWPLEGSLQDVVGTNHGTAVGGVGYLSRKVGSQGIAFNGTNAYVSFGAQPPLSAPWTLSLWVQRTNSFDTSAALFMDNQYGMKLEQFGTTNRQAGFTEFGVMDYNFNFTAPSNNWIQLTFVATAAQMRLYSNNVPVDTNSVSIPLPLQQLGRAAQDRLRGALDEIKVFNRALSDQEVSGLYFQSR